MNRRHAHVAQPIAALLLAIPALASGATWYVSDSLGVDTNGGLTPSTPRKTIQSALAEATSPSEIRVAEGTYVASAFDGTRIVLKPGVSLVGGWNDTFTVRDPSAFLSRIEDHTTSGAEGGAMVGDVSMDGSTMVFGFVIQGGNADETRAVHLTNGAKPTLIHDVILAGDAPAAYPGRSVALSVDGDATILASRFQAGGGYFSIGIEVTGGSPVIGSNVVFGGFGATFAFGIDVSGGSPSIVWNTIDGGDSPSYAYGVYFSSSAPAIDDNVVFTTNGGVARICLGEGNQLGLAATIRNNDLFDCPAALHVHYHGPTGGNCAFNSSFDCLTDIAQVNDPVATGATEASDNVTLDPGFLDRANLDYRLGPSSPTALREGAFDRTDLVAYDHAEVARSAPFSMGAYEWVPGGGPSTPGRPEADVMACSQGGGAGVLALAVLALLAARRRRSGAVLLVLSCLAAAPARAAPPDKSSPAKIVVLALRAGAGIDPKVAEAVSEAFVVAVEGRVGGKVIAPRDLEAILGLERQRQLLGCTDNMACIAEIGGALGVQRIVYGSIARLGPSLTFSAQVIDVATGSALRRSLQRVQGTEDALLDAAERTALELFPPAANATAAKAPPVAPPPPAPAPGKAPGPPPPAASPPASAAGTSAASTASAKPPPAGTPPAASGRGLFASVSASANVGAAGGLAALGLGWRFGDRLSAEVRGAFTGGGYKGVGARVALGLLATRWRPVVALDALWLSGEANVTALGGEVALEGNLTSSVRVSIGIPVLFLASGPEDTQASYFLAGGGMSVLF